MGLEISLKMGLELDLIMGLEIFKMGFGMSIKIMGLEIGREMSFEMVLN